MNRKWLRSGAAWSSGDAQVMAREKRLPRFAVQNSAFWTQFKVGMTVATTNPREPCRERGVRAGRWQRELPGSGRGRCRRSKRLPELPPRWELPVALGYFTLLPELWRDAVFQPPRRWKEPLGAVPMDAILNCSPGDLEDYYNVLGCDELSTVRASPSSPACSQFEFTCVCREFAAVSLRAGMFEMPCAPCHL